MIHFHKFKMDSKNSCGHDHAITGYAGNMIGINSLHCHMFWGISSYRSHTHYFSGMTGMPIKTENGHIHKMEGMLEMNDSHEHGFTGNTFEEVSYTHGNSMSEAYG